MHASGVVLEKVVVVEVLVDVLLVVLVVVVVYTLNTSNKVVAAIPVSVELESRVEFTV